ncbi:MAG TPA: phosphatase PAP2 family protein [Verrucomicrobiae bacterium]|nr:phosphatase PAP2 family protein [Verrucomicrobiae bacterium]
MRRPLSNPARDAVIAAAAALVFLAIAVAVQRGAADGFDLAIRTAIHAQARPALTVVMEGLTQSGGGWILWPVGALIVAALVERKRNRDALLFAIVVLSAEALNESMKLVFHRPRPEPFFGYPLPDTYSFPSGHSFLSFCFYLGLAEILIDPAWTRARKLAAWAAAIVLVLLIGFSRVYLGVHYPTDVLAGYAGAIAWTAIARAAHHRWWG